MTANNVEVFGTSMPSGTVGGDLIDALEVDGFLCTYVADVAGHGVAAGVLMSMVKAAVHMRLTTSRPPGEDLLESVNRVLNPLTGAASYATFAYVLISPECGVTYSTAGHPPIFHLHEHTVSRHSIENLPVAMFAATSYSTAAIEFRPGDVLAIVTDGLTEVFDRNGRELGDSYISSILIRLSSRPLRDIAEEIFRAARSFGKVADDQSLLIVRRRKDGG
jgi:sigma-B regulation protein RsbU (phosphoserine phosphatase)